MLRGVYNASDNRPPISDAGFDTLSVKLVLKGFVDKFFNSSTLCNIVFFPIL